MRGSVCERAQALIAQLGSQRDVLFFCVCAPPPSLAVAVVVVAVGCGSRLRAYYSILLFRPFDWISLYKERHGRREMIAITSQ